MIAVIQPVQRVMRLSDDLTSARAILFKGWLFLLLGLLAAGSVALLSGSWQIVVLLGIAMWAFCRWYYFMFYVIEHYVDSSFKFDGLISFLKYSLKSKKQS